MILLHRCTAKLWTCSTTIFNIKNVAIIRNYLKIPFYLHELYSTWFQIIQMKPGDWKYMLTEVSFHISREFSLVKWDWTNFFIYTVILINTYIMFYSTFSITNLEKITRTLRGSTPPTFWTMWDLLRKFLLSFSIGSAFLSNLGK